MLGCRVQNVPVTQGSRLPILLGTLRALACILAFFTLAVPLRALAAEDVAAASAAFAEAQRAQLRGEHSRAAELFELADQSAPSPAALRSAIRNRESAGQDVRAATLALRALERYPDDRDTRELAQGALDRLTPKLAKVRATCNEPCQLVVDGGLVSAQPVASSDFFVSTGQHTVAAKWPDRPSVEKRVDGVAGAAQEVTFDAPPKSAKPEEPKALPAPAPAPAATAAPAASAPLDPQSKPSGAGLPPAVFWVGTGLTVLAGGFLTWSGLDTLQARDEFEENPTRQGYDDGVELEQRTNILAGATAVLGVTTIAIGLFATDWGGGEASAQVGENGVAFTYRGSLP
jgi:hypothetical protein